MVNLICALGGGGGSAGTLVLLPSQHFVSDICKKMQCVQLCTYRRLLNTVLQTYQLCLH